MRHKGLLTGGASWVGPSMALGTLLYSLNGYGALGLIMRRKVPKRKIFSATPIVASVSSSEVNHSTHLADAWDEPNPCS